MGERRSDENKLMKGTLSVLLYQIVTTSAFAEGGKATRRLKI